MSAFHKILRKPFNGSTIRALLHRQNLTQPLIPHLLHQLQPNSTPIGKNPFPDFSPADQTARFNIYPSFSFGCFLNPISSSGFLDSNPEEAPELDGSGSSTGMIWADSVKKKRKKKMNKHKLKKLKKRLRHCS
ncbi:hypothetical protein SSX86_029341 [Deinandra increscens subsp. villosa]|uniref:Small ribosomal subunit protein mS38 n=1 Tax=Deinandra increscens subsp. villosa TaxID=3103831 RepID=A0AAP0GKG3_9ASTR